MVAVNDAAATINGQHAVGIAIESEAHGSTALHNGLPERLKLRGTAVDIDPLPIGLAVQNGEVSPQGLKHLRSAGCCGTPAEIQNDGDAIEAVVADRGDETVAIGRQQIRALQRKPTAKISGSRGVQIAAKPLLDQGLMLRIKLGAIGTEHLDSIVLRRVMAGGHHQAARRTQLTDQQGHRRGGAKTKRPDLAARRRESSRQG